MYCVFQLVHGAQWVVLGALRSAVEDGAARAAEFWSRVRTCPQLSTYCLRTCLLAYLHVCLTVCMPAYPPDHPIHPLPNHLPTHHHPRYLTLH